MFAVDALGRLAVLHPRPTFAAHSMDTDWYAVDRQGHVGKWSSGEEGAVPHAAYRLAWDELSLELALHHVLAARPADPSERAGHPRILILDHKARLASVRELPGSWSAVLQFENQTYLDMFRAEHAHCVERPLHSAPFALTVRHMLTGAFEDYWSAGAIRLACALPSIVTPRALGFYEYACGFSGPYARETVPEHRALVQDLPPPLRAQLSMLQLPFDFDSTERFDPLTKLPCSTYR